MLDITKTDNVLGKKIHQFLMERGVETPLQLEPSLWTLPNNKIDLIKQKFTDILLILGLDLEDDSLKDTPKRVAKMYVNEIFWGLNYDNFPKITTVENKMKYDEMIIEKNIKVSSMCEHHIQNIDGYAIILL